MNRLFARSGPALLWAALLLPGAAWAQAAGPKVASPYDRLSSDKLIKRLSMLGMTELLDALEGELPAGDQSMKAMGTRGRIAVGVAMSLADHEQQNKELDKAIPLLRKAVQIGDKMTSPSPEENLLWFEYSRDLAVAMGRYRIENPHMLRLRHLQGGEMDRRTVLKYTKEAVELMDFLKDDISEFLQDLRGDMELFIRFGPRTEALQEEVWYNAALIRLNRARVLDAAQRGLLCRDVFAEMKKFSEDPEYGVLYQARFSIGVAQRLLKQYEKADKTLGMAAVPENSDKDLRQKAWFERARNRIEEGVTAKAETAIKQFEQGCMAIWGPSRRPMVDLRVIFLRNYMYELQATQAKDPKKAEALREKAQTVLLSFVEKYADRPDLVKAFLEIVATKFAGVDDLANASAVVLLAKAYSKVESKDPAEVAEAEQLLTQVLTHKDMGNPKIAGSIEPGVLWELAFLKNKARENAAAAAYFALLARKYPDNRLAARSARFAAKSMRDVLLEYQTKGTSVSTGLRLEFIRAIDTLLSKWSEEEGAVLYNFDLGNQCMALATANQSTPVKFHWQTRAIAAFERIPRELVEHMEARHSALEMRTQIVLNRQELAKALKAGNQRTAEDLTGLARQLMEYEAVRLPGGAPTTAPARTADPNAPAGGTSASAGNVGERVEALRKDLTERLKVYSDPQTLVDRLKTYAVAAAAEGKKIAQEADGTADAKKKEELTLLADQLRRFGARAAFQAAEIRYDQVAPEQKEAEDRQKIETAALEDIRALPKKWPGTPVLEEATEFEIRKLVERGDTARAIEMVQGFKKTYPERAQELIALVVRKIEERVQALGSQLRQATTSIEAEQVKTVQRQYQLTFASFAGELYKPIEGTSIALNELDLLVRRIEEMEKKGEFAAVLTEAKSFEPLVAKFQVPPAEVQGAKTLSDLIAEAEGPGVNQAQVLPNLAGALINAVNDLRDAVAERYRTVQLFADSLIHKGRAEALGNEALEAKAAFQKALELFQQCAAVDAARRKVEADLLTAYYAPHIEASKQAKNMEEVRRMIDGLKKELVRVGKEPKEFPDLSTLEYAYEFLSKAPNPDEEKRRLPRTKNLLTRAWEHLLRDRTFHLTVDHRNVIGQARAYRGLKQFPEAMKLYREYTDGVPESSEFFWRAQLERCECHLEGYLKSPTAMKNLVIHINMLALKDKTMGGLAREFLAIKREAEKVAVKARSTVRTLKAGD